MEHFSRSNLPNAQIALTKIFYLHGLCSLPTEWEDPFVHLNFQIRSTWNTSSTD